VISTCVNLSLGVVDVEKSSFTKVAKLYN